MGSDQLDVGPADGGDPDEVIGAREEARERRRKRDLPLGGQTHRGADHILLGDEPLKKPLGALLLELVRVGGVFHVAIHRHHQRVRLAQSRQCRSEGLPRGHLLPQLVGRRRHGSRRRRRGRPGGGPRRRPRAAAPVQLVLQRPDRRVHLLTLLERPAVPPLLVLGERDVSPFERPRQDHGRLVGGARRRRIGRQQLGHVVPVHHQRLPPERRPPRCILLHIVLQHGGLTLPQPVHVHRGAQVPQVVVRRRRRRLPHRSLRDLAIPHQDIDPLVGLLEAPRVQRHPQPYRQPLPQRPRGHVHERQPGRRVALQLRRELAQGEQLRLRDGPRLRPRRVQHRRGVPLGQDEDIRRRIPRISRVIPHHREEQRGHNLGRRGATRRVPAPRLRRGPDRMDSQPRSPIPQSRHQFRVRCSRCHIRP